MKKKQKHLYRIIFDTELGHLGICEQLDIQASNKKETIEYAKKTGIGIEEVCKLY